jgi:ribosomal protein S18 acetylase RimI-like enzyme/predicted enzyme related to lactoylglutathione lyase
VSDRGAGADRPRRPRVRRIRPDEAAALRAVRLRALADTPLAFGSTHAREAAFPPERWRQWARASAAGPRQSWFLAVDPRTDEAPVGLAFATVDDESKDAHLYSMWVAPEARGTGTATALVEAVIAWTTAQGARTLRTAVTTGNEPAARLYARAGFRDTGRREPLGHSDAETALLERALDTEPSGAADSLATMGSLRAFPVLYAKDVARVAGFYEALGFAETFRLAGPDGAPGFVSMRREGGAELGVTTEDSPRTLAGVEPGAGPRHELFVYVEDVDATVARIETAGGTVLKPPADMPWGERVGYVADPEGNVVSLATAASGS